MNDFLVIGGGIIGMMTARYLSEFGSVMLIDKSSCGKAASWAGAGIISPLYPWKYSNFINQLSFKSQQIYQQLCNELLENTGIDPEYINSGLLMMDEFNSENAKDWLIHNNIQYQKINNNALFSVAQVRNSRILKALKTDILNRGVNIKENYKIKKLTVQNRTVIGADTFIAKNTIICAGSWSSELLNNKIIYPIKGQIITVFDKSNKIKNIILKDGKYIVPRQDGVVLIGSTMENVGFDKTLSNTVKNQLLAFAGHIFPHLDHCPITHHWCGFRPATTNDPIIGRDNNYNNLFINAGHFRNGLNTAPESAKIITRKILNAN